MTPTRWPLAGRWGATLWRSAQVFVAFGLGLGPATTLRAGDEAGPVEQATIDFTEEERAVIASFGPWPPARAQDASNRWRGDPRVVAYGERLFTDPGLSSEGRVACSTCHDPARAFQDGRVVAEGRAVGARNTPSLVDVADRRWFGWDGARDSLWAASLAPLLDPREMSNRIADLATTVRGDAQRTIAHEAAFRSRLPGDDQRLVVEMAKALAAYQGTLRSPRTAFDHFRDALLQGDRRLAQAYPVAARRGLRLFIGKARCHVCHAGPAFTNDEFADIGVPFFVAGGVDSGRHGGLLRLLESPFNRLGAFNDAGEAADGRAVLTRHLKVEPRHFGEFRVPGLRQLTRTAPYMHDGSLPTLHDVVRHYDHLDEERLHADGERILRRLDLTGTEAEDLVAFLRTLSD